MTDIMNEAVNKCEEVSIDIIPDDTPIDPVSFTDTPSAEILGTDTSVEAADPVEEAVEVPDAAEATDVDATEVKTAESQEAAPIEAEAAPVADYEIVKVPSKSIPLNFKEDAQAEGKDEEPVVEKAPAKSGTSRATKRAGTKAATTAEASKTAKTPATKGSRSADKAEAAPKTKSTVGATSTARKTPMEKALEKNDNNRNAALADARQREAERQQRQEESAHQLMAVASLVNAQKTQQYVRGVISSAEELKGNVFAVVWYDNIKVMIAYEDMYVNSVVQPDPSKADVAADLIRRKLQLITKSIGAEITYIVTGVFAGTDATDVVARGSRKEYLLRTQRHFFGSRNGADPIMKAGSRVDGTIVAVGRHAVRICIGGVETRIQTNNLTCRPAETIDNMFYVGQIIPCDIGKVWYDEKTDSYEISASAKRAEQQRLYAKNSPKITCGGIYHATVTVVHPISRGTIGARAFLYIESIGCPAVSNKIQLDSVGTRIAPGDVVVFQATHKNDNENIIFGNVLRKVTDIKQKLN